MTTNDHTVPQMYLKWFAERRGRKHQIVARRVDDLENPFSTTVKNVTAVHGFYWGTTLDGVPHHEAEKLLCQIESDASPVFAEILDDPMYALPYRWPLGDDERLRMSWWIAAQLLRTTRQRKRLAYLADKTNLPSLEQEANIEAIVLDRKGRLAPILGRQIDVVPYSSKTKYGLQELFTALIGSCPKGRSWISVPSRTSDHTTSCPRSSVSGS
jgi:hypothetical protein